jgi:excisionase family DNA binding protein
MSSVSTRNEVGDQRFLTVEELAALCHVKPRTVYEWIARRAVPYRKAGRRALFRSDEIEEWMEQRGLRLEQIA